MGTQIEKKDLISQKTQFENLLVNALINIDCYKVILDMLNNKLKEFPDEKTDPMPEEIKEIVEKVQNA